MEYLGLDFGKTEGISNCCYSCVNGEAQMIDNRVLCGKGTLMNPNEYCNDFSIDLSRNPQEVIDFVTDYIQKNLGI